MTAEQIGRGRTSDVYAFGEDRAVKLYPAGEDRDEVEQEAKAAALVHGLGVPSVRCDGLTEVDGRLGIIFERLDGISFNEVAERDLRKFGQVCRDLADCHARMHAAHTTELPDVRELAIGLLAAAPLTELGQAEREALTAHLRSLPDGDSVLHLDYHPQNVFQHRDGWAIIDWHSACRGAAAADVAMSAVLMSEVELFPGTPPLKLVLYELVRRVMRRLYLARYFATTELTAAQVNQWLTCARVLRLGLLNIDSERTRLLGKVRAALEVAKA
jgi:Putative homoserine kinase type II (protein kinase fold)